MIDINEIRHRNYRVLFSQFKMKEANKGQPERGALNRFGEFVGISPRYLTHINSHRKNIGDATARQMEQAFKLPHGWLDHDHIAGPLSGNRAEREFVELALKLFRESPVEAQAVLLRYMADRIMGNATAPDTTRTKERVK